jgi:hypothetical protein
MGGLQELMAGRPERWSGRLLGQRARAAEPPRAGDSVDD